MASQRVLEKGVEVDLYTTVLCRGDLLWESLNTFYYRGRFGGAGEASPLSRAPEAVGETVAEWRTVPGLGRRFAALTGDYNGIHCWSWYARLLGFRGALHHPQLLLGQCLARLSPLDPSRPQRLDAWLKGPVYYGARVCLREARGRAVSPSRCTRVATIAPPSSVAGGTRPGPRVGHSAGRSKIRIGRGRAIRGIGPARPVRRVDPNRVTRAKQNDASAIKGETSDPCYCGNCDMTDPRWT